jgi:hypothetical protein
LDFAGVGKSSKTWFAQVCNMKRVYKQTILDDDGNVYATRTVEFNEDERTYKSPVFISNLMKLERDFLDEMFEVTTEVIE